LLFNELHLVEYKKKKTDAVNLKKTG